MDTIVALQLLLLLLRWLLLLLPPRVIHSIDVTLATVPLAFTLGVLGAVCRNMPLLTAMVAVTGIRHLTLALTLVSRWLMTKFSRMTRLATIVAITVESSLAFALALFASFTPCLTFTQRINVSLFCSTPLSF